MLKEILSKTIETFHIYQKKDGKQIDVLVATFINTVLHIQHFQAQSHLSTFEVLQVQLSILSFGLNFMEGSSNETSSRFKE